MRLIVRFWRWLTAVQREREEVHRRIVRLNALLDEQSRELERLERASNLRSAVSIRCYQCDRGR